MKRYIKRWISFILFMCVFVQYPSEGVVMAADSDQKNIQIVGTASMNTYDVALRVGKTKQLVCNGTTGKMVWKSSNPKVATVDKKGLVKAIKPGKAMISVSGGNLIGSMTCKVGDYGYEKDLQRGSVLDKRKPAVFLGSHELSVLWMYCPVWRN